MRAVFSDEQLMQNWLNAGGLAEAETSGNCAEGGR